MLLLLALACTEDPDGDGYTDDDCAPESIDIHPGAHEICDGVDNDCDGAVDETFDGDGDGFLADEADCRALGDPTDCDDTDPEVHPGADDPCDGVDNDCSGTIDDAIDGDGDGWSACEDCDDGDAYVNPGAPEVCDGLDNNCSGTADEDWDEDYDGVAPCAGDCDDTDPDRSPLVPERCDSIDNDCDDEVDEGFDEDADGVTTCRGDCDDENAAVNPAQDEVCDGFDNDCDDTTVDYADLDGDGQTWCDGDCDDINADVHAGAAEACDGVDNDCNGAADDSLDCLSCVDTVDYLICFTYETFDDARAICQSFGRDLTVLEGPTENDTLSELAASYTSETLWIGLTDSAVEGTFAWVDGSPLTFSSWNAGEPNDSGGEDCVSTNYGSLGYWNDYPCSGSLGFICE